MTSITYTTSYQYAGGILTQTNIDSTDNPTKVQYQVSKELGPVITKTLPLGQMETFEYDMIGRVVKYTDALGNVTTTSYSVGADGN